MSVIYTNQEELDAALALWQKRLRLQDWLVKAKIVRGREMSELSAGRNIMTLSLKSALILLLDPVDWDAPSWPQDHEETLVHELLHLHIEPLLAEVRSADEALYERLWMHYEQILSSLDGAFVKLARGGE